MKTSIYSYLSFTNEKCCVKSKCQRQRQVIASHTIRGISLLVSVFDTFFWNITPQIWFSYHEIGPQFVAWRVSTFSSFLWFGVMDIYDPFNSSSRYGNSELNFVMNFKVDGLFSRVLMGWMLVVEITGYGDLGCNMSPKGTVGPRYSTRLNRSILLTDNLGKIIFN